MKVLALSHTAPAEHLAEADLVRPSIADVDLDEILISLRNAH
jgi:hypothetical protein